MIRPTIRFEGWKETEQALHEVTQVYTSAYGKKLVRKGLEAGGEPIRAAAQAAAPARPAGAGDKRYRNPPKVGELRERKPGTLKALFQMGSRLTRNQRKLVRKADKSSTVEVYVGTRDRIALLEEFGTRRARAHLMLTHAWAAHKDGAFALIKAAIVALLTEAVARANKRIAQINRKIARR